MVPSERSAAAVLVAIGSVLGSVVLFDVYEDWLVQGNPLVTALLENAIPLALVGALLYTTYWLFRAERSYLPTVAKWTAIGVVGVLGLGGLVLGIQLVQGRVKPLILAAHTAIGGAVGGVVVGYTIAELRATRAETEREKRRHQSLFENTPTAIADVVIADETIVVESANDAFRGQFGDGAAGRPLAATAPVEELETDLLTGAAEGTTVTSDVTQSVSGERRFYTLRFVPYDIPGDADRAYALFVDITDQKQTQYELEQAVDDLERQNERLDQFVSVVSHDLRNPLSIAMGNLDIARERGDSEAFDAVDDALDRMDELIDDLLTLAREGRASDDPQPVDLETAARNSWETVDTETATLRVDADATVLADPSRLRQLFENLFRNAVEHGSTSPDSGTRQDEAERDLVESEPLMRGSGPDPDAQDETADDDGPAVTVRVGTVDGGFYVEDDGPGIPDEERDQVFEPGYTTADEGTGFGLTIVSEVARAHGWDVSVGDAHAAGTGVRFEFGGVDRL